jgi:hypothetical protein
MTDSFKNQLKIDKLVQEGDDLSQAGKLTTGYILRQLRIEMSL